VRVAVALVALAGCASLPQGEYRGDVYQHRDHAYSFRVPNAWRGAAADDLEAFAYFSLALRLTHDPGRVRERLKGAWNYIDAALVSSQGAGIFAMTAPNPDGVRLPREAEISRAEREMLIDFARKEFSGGLGAQSKSFLLESADLNQYGPNPALSLNIRSRQAFLGGPLRVRALMLTGRRHVVMLAHVGIPEDGDAGLDALDAVVRSFRFD